MKKASPRSGPPDEANSFSILCAAIGAAGVGCAVKGGGIPYQGQGQPPLAHHGSCPGTCPGSEGVQDKAKDLQQATRQEEEVEQQKTSQSSVPCWDPVSAIPVASFRTSFRGPVLGLLHQSPKSPAKRLPLRLQLRLPRSPVKWPPLRLQLRLPRSPVKWPPLQLRLPKSPAKWPPLELSVPQELPPKDPTPPNGAQRQASKHLS